MTPEARRVVVWAASLLAAAAGYSGEYEEVILFAEYEITTQALIDAAVVLVNDNRVEVDLTEQ